MCNTHNCDYLPPRGRSGLRHCGRLKGGGVEGWKEEDDHGRIEEGRTDEEGRICA